MGRRSAAKSSPAGVGAEDTGWGRGAELARSVIGMFDIFLLLVERFRSSMFSVLVVSVSVLELGTAFGLRACDVLCVMSPDSRLFSPHA